MILLTSQIDYNNKGYKIKLIYYIIIYIKYLKINNLLNF